jgi:anti-sigma-K factor RskA
MKHEHITRILEETPLSSLNEAELAAIRTHASECQDCLQAYEAAYVSASLLKEHAAEAFEPSPFFQTRVLAALRERQGATDVWSLSRLWRSAGAMVSSMAATVAILAGLSFVVPSGEPVVDQVSINSYPADEMIFNQGEFDDQISDGQILNTLYDADEDARK